jgi:hypothetical protein
MDSTRICSVAQLLWGVGLPTHLPFIAVVYWGAYKPVLVWLEQRPFDLYIPHNKPQSAIQELTLRGGAGAGHWWMFSLT